MIARNMNQNSDNQSICIGRITSAHGVRGLVKIKIYTDSPQDIGNFSYVYSSLGKEPVKIQYLSSKGDLIIARIEGVNDRNEAEKLHGVELYIERSELPDTKSDEFYYADLVGMEALYSDGLSIGFVTNIMNYGAGDIIEVQDPATNRTIYYPFNKEFIQTVDLKSRTISVNKVQEEVICKV